MLKLIGWGICALIVSFVHHFCAGTPMRAEEETTMMPVPPKAMPEGPAADQPKTISKARLSQCMIQWPCVHAHESCTWAPLS